MIFRYANTCLQTYVYIFEIWVDNRVVNDQPRPARSEVTKTRILEAARLLFAEEGFDAWSRSAR
jgi:hypothetical protein